MTGESIRATAALGVILMAFAVVRLPAMLRQPGGQDEDYYAVPGWTILREGLPRIPYVPSRDRQGVFYQADRVLYALPPAYFYYQALVYALIGPGYGQGRIASAIAGGAALLVVFALARKLTGSQASALWAAAIYSVSRAFFFPATFARPDMLCALFALASILAILPSAEDRIRDSADVGAHPHPDWRKRPWIRATLLAGFFCGLALLCHPFALLAAIHLAIVAMLEEKNWHMRLATIALAGLAASFVVLFWLPLILIDAESFLIQFGNNVWNRSGPGLLSRFLWPWESLAVQSRLFLEHATLPQILAYGAGLIFCLAIPGYKNPRGNRLLVVLAGSSVLLLMILQGTHPAKGYWCYPAAYLSIALGRLVNALVAPLVPSETVKARAIRFAAAALVLFAFLPGSGLRAWFTHVMRWNDPNHDARAIARQMLHKLPADAAYLVDVGFVFDFYLAERKTTLALNIAPFWEAEGLPYDFLIVSPTGIEQQIPRQFGGEFVQSFGMIDNPLGIYAEVYRPAKR